jgi:molybdenum cofactor biosynthesis enzyme MoaA
MSPSLTQGFRCEWAHFEITSNCNLACVYCAVSQPGYVGVSISMDKASAITRWLIKNGVPNINLNGHGETTIVRDWDTIVAPLLESEARCHIITNAAKSYSDAELDALCRLKSITISCDTFDSELYARFRRKSELRFVLRAIHRIRLAAIKRRQKPAIILSCVLGAENSEHLEEFILAALCMNIQTIQLCSLTEYPMPLDSSFQISPLSALSQEQLLKLKRVLITYGGDDDPAREIFLSVHPRIFSEIELNLAALSL